MTRTKWLAGLAVLVVLTAWPAWAQQSIDTRSGVHAGYARLAFEPSSGGKITISAELDGKQLIVHFDKPVTTRLGVAQFGLSSYIDNLQLDPSGLLLTGTVKKSVTLKTTRFEPGVEAIDLIDAPAPAPARPAAPPAPVQPPPKTAAVEPPPPDVSKTPTVDAPPPIAPAPETPAATPPAPAGKRVTVAINVVHAGDTDQLILSPFSPVRVTVGEVNDQARMTFDRPVKLRPDRVNAKLPEALRPFTVADDALSASFGLPFGRHLKQRTSADKIVIEVTPLAPPQRPDDSTPATASAATPASPADAPPAEAAKSVAADGPKPAASTPVTPASSPGVKTASVGPTTSKPAASAAPASAIAPSGAVPLKTALGDDGTVSLRFEWAIPTAAAVFRRNDAVWVVFDRAAPLAIDELPPRSENIVKSLASVKSDNGTVLRVQTMSDVYPLVRRAGTSWIVELRSHPQSLGAPITPIVRQDQDQAILDFQALDPASPISLLDPDNNDMLIVVPLPQLGQGVEDAIEFPDVRVLPSVQGLVLRPHSDQLLVQQRPADIQVTAPGGLTLSPPAERALPAQTMKPNGSLLQPADWLGQPLVDYASNRETLLAAVVNAPPEGRTLARLDLAKFYFAHGLAAEALGVLRVAQADVPNLIDDPVLRLIQGASEEMMGQLDAAATDLDDHSLDGRADSLLWRSALAASQKQWPQAATLALESGDALNDYPPALRRRLGLTVAEALMRAGNRQEANDIVDLVLENDPTPGERDLATVLQGRIAAAEDDVPKALELWHSVADSPRNDLGRAQATYALLLTSYDRKETPLPDAIAGMDRLRYAWRGDEFEVLVLNKLAEWYAADGNFRMVFQTLQHIPANFPDTPEAKDALAQMQKSYIDAFLGPAADTTSPLTALGLYQEFKELTPTGPEGDAIIRKLADRLVAVDLLGRAGDLLQDQVKGRLSGVEQARVATQLALVRLMDHRPQDAIAALDLITASGLPADLGRQQTELRGRALAELDRSDEALTLLASDDSEDANRLRADIYGKTGQWGPLAATLQKGLPDPKIDAPLAPGAASTILRAATALVLAGDRNGLNTLQHQYGPGMDKSDYKDAFRVVAGAADAETATFKTLADRVAQIGDLQSFMSSYRQRVQQDKLSTIN